MSSQALLAGVASSLFFVILNVAMNIYMKWLFNKDGGDFALPWTMLACQQLQAYMVLQPWLARLDPVSWGWGVQSGWSGDHPEDGQLRWINLLQVLAVTVLFCLNVGLNSLSLVEISITLNQTVRAFLPVGVLLLATLIEQRAYPSHSYWTTVILVCGIALTCWGSPDFEVYGFSLAFISTLVAALGTSLNGRLLSKGPFSKSGPFGIARLMLLQAVPAFFIFALIAWWTEWDKLKRMLGESVHWTWYQRLLLVSFSSALALLSNLGRCFLVAATSALMETLAGNAKVAALCAIDHQLFGTQLFPYNYAGIGMTFAGFSIHVLLQYASREPSPKEEEDEGKGTTPHFEGDDDGMENSGVGPSTAGGKKARTRLISRPRLISAADTGLAAEHVAVEMGRPQMNRTESGDSTWSNASTDRVIRMRSVTWPAPRVQQEEHNTLEFSRVLEVPLWLEQDRDGRGSALLPEEYSPLSANSGLSPAARAGAGGASPTRGGLGSPAAGRSRAHTDPTATLFARRNLLEEGGRGGALGTVVEEQEEEEGGLVGRSATAVTGSALQRGPRGGPRGNLRFEPQGGALREEPDGGGPGAGAGAAIPEVLPEELPPPVFGPL